MLELLASRFSTQPPPVAVAYYPTPTPAEAAKRDTNNNKSPLCQARDDKVTKAKTPSKRNRDKSTSPADSTRKKSTKTSAAVEAA
jgi:hypothetical protein